jgi:hypothetical protein
LIKGNIPSSANAHSQVLTKFLAYLLITIGRIREHQKVGGIQKQILLLFVHPFLAKISKATTSKALLADRMDPHAAAMPKTHPIYSLEDSLHKGSDTFFLENKIITRTPNCLNNSCNTHKD